MDFDRYEYQYLNHHIVHPLQFEDEREEVDYPDTTKRFYGNVWITAILYLLAGVVGIGNLYHNLYTYYRTIRTFVVLHITRLKRLIGIRR